MLLILLTVIIFNFLPLSSEQDLEKFISKDNCSNHQLIEVMKSHFSTRQCISLIYLSQDMYVPNEYFRFSNLPQVVLRKNESMYKPKTDMRYRPRRDFHTEHGNIVEFCEERLEGFLLFVPNLKTLTAYTFTDMITAFMNPKAYFVIIVSKPFTTKSLSTYFVRLWQVYHILHLGVTCCTCSKVYIASSAERDGVAAYEIDQVSPHIGKHLWQLNGLQLKICMFPSVMAQQVEEGGKKEYEGVDRMMVDLLAEKMNFTKVLVDSPNDENYGSRKQDGSFSGSIGVLVKGRAEMVGVGFFAMDYQTRDIEPTQGVQVDDLCAIVHKAKEVPPWLAPAKYLGYGVCLSLLLVYFGVAGVWIAMRRFETPAKNFDVGLICLKTFGLMLSASVSNISDRICERLFLTFCFGAFLTLTGTFQGSLVTVYSTQFFYKDINTLEALAESEFPILTRFESFKKDIFTNESNDNDAREKLKDLVDIYDGSLPINTLIAKDGNVAGLSRRSSIELDKQVLQYRDKNGNLMIHLVRECIRTYNLAYMLPRASALSTRINEIILRASQAGLFGKWYKGMAVNNTKYLAKKQYTSSRNQNANVPLSLVDLQLAIGAFILGLFVSLLAFIFETVRIRFGVQLRCVLPGR